MKDLPESCIQSDTLLRRKGFQCREVETGDGFRRRRFYHKDYREDDSNVMVRVELKFELSIQDAPGGSYDDNHHLYHEGTSLIVFDRQIPEKRTLFGDTFYDEEAEDLREIGRRSLWVHSLEDLDRWIGCLR